MKKNFLKLNQLIKNSFVKTLSSRSLNVASISSTNAKVKKEDSYREDLSQMKSSLLKNTLFDKQHLNNVTRSKILYTLKVVNEHLSYKSCENNNELFRKMFPDSKIARDFQCQRGKTAYIATFGLGPYFHNEIKETVKRKQEYVLLFDETLNEELQKKQLDIYVRIWADVSTVATYFLTLKFMGHAAATHLKEKIFPILNMFGFKGLLQSGMDGPNVNWALFDIIAREMKSNYNVELLNVGSCGLHTVNNAFQLGIKVTGWNVKDFLIKIYNLLHECRLTAP